MAISLSSRWTPFYKFLLPLLAAGAICVGAWRAFARPDELNLPPGMPQASGGYLFLAVAAIVAVIIGWSVGRLKRIELEGDDLIISNYRAEIRVSLSAVENISAPSRSNPKRYTLTFDESTDFGRRVTFMPPMVWSLNPWKEPEEVDELRAAWMAARGRTTHTREAT